jgi:hypothetical protein
MPDAYGCGDAELVLRTCEGRVELDPDAWDGVLSFEADEATALGWRLLKAAEDVRGSEKEDNHDGE